MEMKYNELETLDAVRKHIESTYTQHYVGKADLQTVDVWDMLGTADTTCRDNAIKYLSRFGKKKHNTRKADLIKAIHCVVLAIHFSEKE